MTIDWWAVPTRHADLRNHGPRNQTLPASPGHPHPARVQELHPPGLDGRGPGRGGERPHQRPGRRRHRAHGRRPDAVGGRDRLAGHHHPGDGPGGRWLPAPLPIYLGNSGTSMRFLTALAALGEGEYLLTGTERLCQRPLGELLEALGQVGVQAVSERGDGCPPVRVTGGLTGGQSPALRRPSAASTSRPCCSSGPWRPRASRSTSPASWCPGPTWT